MEREAVRLMLVEDNEADVFLMEAALEMAGLPVQLQVARDGEDALRQLRAALGGGTLPHLMLLDLNMPRISGFEVLQAVRADPGLRHLVVVVFTTSSAQADVQRAYALQANSYLSKPATMTEFLRVVELLDLYWFGAANLPQSHAPA
ncbi:response regulator [Deinococcus arcticus]|uniref:Response regulator n=1 Tax=Deinococcus arcticus TaxID=2136176 RepID=A0A2T3W5N8_9DEIO|nr:response regulator [Deinococcus arcticus]PTA67216.1 response regulator [Deinococcus arcticus]